jgi:eukaryotic-like serine/threonine-protein kinase
MGNAAVSAPGTGEPNGRLLAGRYRLVEQLGRGGMGVVYRARDEVLGREVAVKELRTFNDASSQELGDLRLRMQREARAAARIRHHGVVAVHDVIEHDGRPVIVMELVDGPSLDDVLRQRGSLDPHEAAAIGAAVADALGAAHAAGVLHRDVKPGNILLEPGGRVVLTDFGIATMDDPGDGTPSNLTSSGQLVGSLDFLAPERAQGQRPGPASDVWSLGAMLFAAVEGTPPFRRTSTWSAISAIVSDPVPAPHRAGPLAPVLHELMTKDPHARPDAQRAGRLLRTVARDGYRGPVGTVGAGTPGLTDPATQRLDVRGEQPRSQPSASAAPPPFSPPRTGPERPTRPEPGWRPPVGVDARVPQEPQAAPAAGGGGRRRLLIASAAAAIVLVGGGVAWTLAGNSGSGGPGSGAAQPGTSVEGLPVSPSDPGASASTRRSPSPDTRPSLTARTPTPAVSTPGPGGGPNGSGGTAPAGTGGKTTGPRPKPTPKPKPAPWKACKYYGGTANTEYGDTGSRVKEVQCILIARGYGVGSGGTDGQFGKDTEAAVKRFQTDRHLEIDGQVGPQTWAALRG